jgi:hypothetical protein
VTSIHTFVELGDNPHTEIGSPQLLRPRLTFRDDDRGCFELVLAGDRDGAIAFLEQLAANCAELHARLTKDIKPQ